MRRMGQRSGRRATIARSGLAIALAFALTQTAAAAPSPQGTIQGFYATLLTSMKQGRKLGESGRYALLAPIVQQVFDLPFMTRLAVGPDWTGLTQSQQQQVTTAFGRYVAATYAYRFDSYSGQSLQVGGEEPSAGGYIVRTTIVKPTGDPVTINYLMREDGGAWQIADVYLDGTISQLATQRSEFHSILQRKGVDGLISALNRKVDLLERNADNSQ